MSTDVFFFLLDPSSYDEHIGNVKKVVICTNFNNSKTRCVSGFYLLTCESSSIDFPEKLQNRGKKEQEAERLVTIYTDCNNH
jgi:hypothetical protein